MNIAPPAVQVNEHTAERTVAMSAVRISMGPNGIFVWGAKRCAPWADKTAYTRHGQVHVLESLVVVRLEPAICPSQQSQRP